MGRHAKVGKEEIAKLLKAVSTTSSTWRAIMTNQRLWHGYMSRVSKEVRDIPTVKSEIYVPGPGGHPILSACAVG
ncbi:MAG: hypothetical protein R2748_29540 [Bryobacterales bacterium]